MRILIINQPFWPDVVATAQHMADWAEYLTQQGHIVSVIASRSVYGKQGAVLPKRDTYKGVAVYRVGSNLFSKGRILTRLVDFGLFHLRALARALTLPKQDVVVCLTTPPMVGMVGRLLKLFRGSRYIQYEMDLYPDIAVALGVMKPHGIPARLFDGIHRYLLRKANRIVVLGRCMQRVIEAKGIPADKLVLVTPWADPDEIVPVPRPANRFRQQYGLTDKFIVMYSGNLGLGHDIATLTTVLEQLGKSPDAADVHFVFIGGGRRMREVETFVQQRGLRNVLILEYQPRESLGDTLSAADVHLITQAPAAAGLIVPSKFYGILAAGRPSIYIGPDDTEVAMTIREHQLGYDLRIGDHQGLADAIRRARDAAPADRLAFEAHARTYLRENHSRAICCQKLKRALDPAP